MGDVTGRETQHPDRGQRDPRGRAAGIELDHLDGFGRPCRPSAATISVLLEAMGLGHDHQPPHPGSLVVVPGEPRPQVAWGTTVILEDGTELATGPHTTSEDGNRRADLSADLSASLPADLPVGYHRAVGPDGSERALLVSPGRCHLPSGLRAWGVTAQLYAARSSRSWGIGDLRDLATVVDWARKRGASLVGVNPFHAPTPTNHPPDSPYSPSTRCWRDPLLISLDEVPGFADLPDANALARAGRALNGPLIDRSAIWQAKRAALESVWQRFRNRPDSDFERYLSAGGDGLIRWGTYCAIADAIEKQGGSPAWPTWPSELRHPENAAVTRRRAETADQVRFWAWLQWLIDRQLAAADPDDLVLHDLAVGFAPDGFDAWQWQDLTAPGVSIGAPPDPLGPDGQNWGLAPFVPWKLDAAGYRPLVDTIRAITAYGRGLRVDHVMGLFRLFWVPPGCGAAEGAYVRFAHHDLLHVLAIESHRRGALVVGEDLGTVQPGVRETLAAAGVLSTRLLWFEEQPPTHWPRQAMAAITTHDLPTVSGVWTGTDLQDLAAAGVTVPDDGHALFRHRLRVAASASDDTSTEEMVTAAYRAVAAGPSMLATAALDDLVGASHRPNVPGTIDQHPNWRLPLPVDVERLDGYPLAESVAAAMAGTRTPSPGIAQGP